MEGKSAKTPREIRKRMKSRKKKFMKKSQEKIEELLQGSNRDCYEYLVRIAEIIDTVRNDHSEMEVLAGNVFNEINGNEVTYSKIGITSRLIEELLPYASHEHFTQFVQNFTDNLRPVFTDRTASHILQKITVELLNRYSKLSPESTDNKQNILYVETLTKISGFGLNNLDTFIWEPSSNHVIRAILSVLSGCVVKGDSANNCNKVCTPAEFQSLLLKFAQAITALPDLAEMCNETLTSGLLQTLLTALKDNEGTCKSVIKKIIAPHKKNPPDFTDVKTEPLLRLLESALEVANQKQFAKLYKIFFSKCLKELSISKTGNFAIQKLIRNCKDKELYEALMDELQPIAESILEAENTGVLLELAQSCGRFKTKQGEFVKMMMRILQCQKTLNEDSDIVPLTCSMVTSKEYNPEEPKINLHGTLIIQKMLNFGKPIKIINSLLNMETKNLIQLISDPMGCHIVDAFVQSSTVGEKSRERLFRRLSGYYTEMAMSKYGSRSLDAIWGSISTKSKVLLLEEIKDNESELNSNQYGKLFSRKTYLRYFRRNREEWMKWEKTVESTEKCFSDIIQPKKPKLEG